MSYITIDLNKMSDAGKIAYLIDLVRDMRDLLAGDDSLDEREIVDHANKALDDMRRAQDIKQFMREHFQLIHIGGK
jgi:hypothetical protein